MLKKSFLVTSEYGIHARPATRLVNLAMTFESEIDLTAMGKTINLKSIMGLMSLGVYKGERVTIGCDGRDEAEALEKITDFILTESIGRLADE
ncbi:MAG: HPr family phosphocarrier protein [Acholeplasmataceae bacterium]